MLKSIATAVKNAFLAVYSLVQEPDGSKMLSLGRVAFISLFGSAMYVWIRLGTDIPGTMENILIAVMVYVLGGKVTTKVSEIVGQIKKYNDSKRGEE